jgi:hypothetical protein
LKAYFQQNAFSINTMLGDRTYTHAEITEITALRAELTAAEEGRIAEKKGRSAEKKGRIAAEEGRIAEEKGRIAEKKGRIAAEAQLKSTNKCTLEEFCKKRLYIHDNSESTAHVPKGNKKATIVKVDNVPLFELQQDFWTSSSVAEYRPGQRIAQNEAQVETFTSHLVQAVADALGASGYFEATNLPAVVPQVNVMDIIPDLSICFGRNRYMGGTIEVKKHVVGQLPEIFGEQVAGQAFEQLYLSKFGLPCNSYGLITTYNCVLLISTGNLQDDMKKLNAKFAAKGRMPTLMTPPLEAETVDSGGTTENHTTPDAKLPADVAALKTIPERKSGGTVQPVAKPVQDANSTPKNKKTRVTAAIEASVEGCVGYVVHALPRADFATNDDFDTNHAEEAIKKNRKVIQTIATFLLLAELSVSDRPRDVSKIPLEGPVRVINTSNIKNEVKNGPSSCTLQVLQLPGGILFNQHPTGNECKFYAWSQLGVGSTGTCCLATVASGAACVLKFFHHKLDEEEDDREKRAKEERKNWDHIYKEEQWTFINYYEVNGTFVLVMPYLRAPKDKAERDMLLKDVPGFKNTSLLWKALKTFAARGKKHDDLKWSHVGIGLKASRKRTRSNEKIAGTVQQVFLLDLGRVSDLAPDEASKWVAASFEKMKARNGGK